MKNYLKFDLTGKKLLPFWLAFLVLFLAPYMFFLMKISSFQQGATPSFLIFPLMILLVVVALAIVFFIARLTIINVGYRDSYLTFRGGFGLFMGKLLLGLLLTIITLGIYGAWFVKDIHSFFINNSSYNSQPFTFKGKGSILFVIILLTVFLPIIALSIIMATIMIVQPDSLPAMLIIQQIITMIIMIPYMYYLYRWMVNIDYNGFNIRWRTNFWNSCGKIALEIILSIITLGIYFPLASIRLYKYFIDRTSAVSADRERKFGFDIDPLNDFLFLWGQILLSIITLWVYYPWAFSRIGKRFLGRTYIE